MSSYPDKYTMQTTLCDYELLADLFIYPNQDNYKERITEIYNYLLQVLPEAAEELRMFLMLTQSSSLKEMQELYLRSFDVQAITTLDIGFILFGEDYKRGQLLVNLNREHKEVGNICHTELADHLPNVLRLVNKMTNIPMRDEIVGRLVLPAIVKMISEFSIEKIGKKDEVYKKHQMTVLEYSLEYRTIYKNLLQAVFFVLKKDFGYTPAKAVGAEVKNNIEKQSLCAEEDSCSCSNEDDENDFKSTIETEMIIEKD